MKRILLLALLAFSVQTFAQTNPCIPNMELQDSLFGLWPDTIENLEEGEVNVYYEDYVQIKTPATAGEVPDVPEEYSIFSIDSIGLVEALGLPEGLEMSCSTPSCIYNGDEVGCVTIYGTTTEGGVHDLTFVVDGWITVFGAVLAMSDVVGYVEIEGYKLIINGDGTSIDVVYANSFSVLQNTPNPVTDKTTIYYNVVNNQKVTLEVFNMLGTKIKSESLSATNGVNQIDLDASQYEAGIYFYTLSNGDQTISKRMIVASR